MPSRVVTKVGDIVEIPLSAGTRAFGQFTYRHRSEGDLLQVFDYVVPGREQVDINELVKRDLLFPPMFTIVATGIKQGLWEKIGNRPVKHVIYPVRVYTFWDPSTGVAGNWFLVTQNERINLGAHLLEDYKKFDFAALYAPDLIVKRIETGERPYDSLIRTNKLLRTH